MKLALTPITHMNKKTYTIISIIILIFIVLFIAYARTNGDKNNTKQISQEPNTVPIGFVGALSGDGASWGIQQKNAVKMAFDEIQKSKKFENIEFNVIYEDGKCSNKDALNAVSKLINADNVSYVLGGICSGETIGAAPLFEEHGVIDFSWGSSPEISDLGQYIFRNSPSDSIAGPTLAREVIKNNHNTIAIMIGQTDFTSAFTSAFAEEFESLGGVIVSKETISPDETDFKTSVLKIKNSNPNAVFVLHNDNQKLGTMVKQLRELNVLSQIYSAYSFNSDETIQSAGKENAKGIIYVDAPKLDLNNSASEKFINDYTGIYGERPQANEFYAGAAYDSAYIIANTVKQCGTDTECAKRYLHNLTYSGVLGTYSFDENGDVVGITYDIQKVR